VKFLSAQSILDAGIASTLPNTFATAEETALIMYTSGSTGIPKGCELLQSNIIAGAASFSSLGVSISPGDSIISFLPLAHIYALACEIIVIAQGGKIGFARGPVAQLTDDMKALKPTLIISVPRVLNRVYEVMQQTIAKKPAFVQALIRWAVAQKNAAIRANRAPSMLLDVAIFKPFREGLGGCAKVIVNGGAPIMKEVFEFLEATVTPNILQGYGLTETATGVAVQEVPAHDPQTVGPCGSACEVRLRAVPDTQYDASGENPRGELLVRGPCVFKGYYKNPEMTKEAFDRGWFATGDVVTVTDKAELKIIDRAKQLVKMSQGEYISLTTLSEQYGQARDVGFIYVFADSMHDAPVALVFPTQPKIKEWAAAGVRDIPNSSDVHKHIIAALNEVAEAQKLRGFERIKRVLVDTIEPSIENGLVTPSMKPQYNTIKQRYGDALRALYN
jgi:long-chain acyl-CoA synthetase